MMSCYFFSQQDEAPWQQEPASLHSLPQASHLPSLHRSLQSLLSAHFFISSFEQQATAFLQQPLFPLSPANDVKLIKLNSDAPKRIVFMIDRFLVLVNVPITLQSYPTRMLNAVNEALLPC
jgi:hypothetical protein